MSAHIKSEQPAAEPAATPGTTRLGQTIGSLTHGFRALRVRNYRLFWIGQMISLSGSWMQTTAQAWLVLQLTQSPFALGVVTTLQFLPIMLLSLFGGVLIDQFSKHRIVLLMQTLALIQAAIFGVLVGTDLIQLWHVYILAAIQGTINAFDNPARQAFVPELAGREHLVNAIALNSMLFNSARIIGPAIAGIVIAQFGIAPALYLNAASFIAVIAGLLMMDTSRFFKPPQRRGGIPIRQQVVEGLRYVWRTAPVLQIMLVVAAIGTFGYNFNVVLPLLAGFILHTDVQGFGSLSAFLGIGSLLAAITTAYTRQVTMRRLLIGSGMFSVLLALVAFSTNFALSAVLLMALGFAGITFATTANTLLQLAVPDELRGRVMSLYILLFAGSTPIGGFLIGSLSDLIGVAWTLLICAGLCLAGVIGATLYHRRTI